MTGRTPRAHFDDRYSAPQASATPWDDVHALLENAELFWITTVRADGRPHVTPLPAVWHDDALQFCTGAEEQKGVNLAGNRHCALTTGTNLWNSGLDVVVEGRAERVEDDAELRRLAGLWAVKYHGDWQFEVADGAFHQDGHVALVFRVDPDKIIAFAKGPFAQTTYRY